MMDVEKDQQSTTMLRSSIETNVDSQYLCQFTMLLIDTIEELVARVSQIEFVCRQHFPDLQSLSQCIQKRILGFKMPEELEWKKKEGSYISRIHELQLESQHSQEQVKKLNASLEETKESLTTKEKLLDQNLVEKKIFLEQLVEKVNESVRAKGIEEDLLQQIGLKDKKIEVELSKKKILLEECDRLKTNYKHLKSQYKFLICKLGSMTANMPCTNVTEEQKETSIDCVKKRCIEDMNVDNKESSRHPSPPTKSVIGIPPQEDTFTSTKPSHIPPKHPSIIKKIPAGTLKQTTLRWRETRTRQEVKFGDPHDDFLSTPTENAQNLNIIADQNDGDCADEETFDLKLDIMPRKDPVSVPGPSNRQYKYVESVRKKSTRENLKGVECQQCKKFYDAFLPDGGKDANFALRCEHHDEVSRHRYRYAPPLTPEGFWNIGFDTEL